MSCPQAVQTGVLEEVKTLVRGDILAADHVMSQMFDSQAYD